MSDRIAHWLTLAANLGVIVGIAFLVLEIRQNSDIATAQTRLDYAAGWRTVDGQRQDAAFSRVYTKSLVQPDQLTLEEIVQLDGYYTGVLDQLLSAHTAAQASLSAGSFEDVAGQVATGYLSNAFAQAWWQYVRDNWSVDDGDPFLEIMDRAIAAAGDTANLEFYEGIKSLLSDTTAAVE